MLFVRKDIPDIPSKLISKKTLNIDEIFNALTFRNKKWLISCNYNPSKSTITDYLGMGKTQGLISKNQCVKKYCSCNTGLQIPAL